jgi:hypothetical protein
VKVTNEGGCGGGLEADMTVTWEEKKKKREDVSHCCGSDTITNIRICVCAALPNVGRGCLYI